MFHLYISVVVTSINNRNFFCIGMAIFFFEGARFYEALNNTAST